MTFLPLLIAGLAAAAIIVIAIGIAMSAGRGGVASRKTNARAVLLAGKGPARKPGKQSVVRLASAASNAGRAKSSKAAGEL